MIRELVTDYGTMFVPDTDFAQFPFLERGGRSVEHAHIMDVKRLLGERPRGTVLDVGASYGCWTLALASAAKAVWSIEPQPPIAALLHQSIAANELENIHLTQVAVGQGDGRATIQFCDISKDGNFGGVSILEPYERQFAAALCDIDVVTIDGIQLYEPEPVSFIKMDIEGCEQAALDGAVETVRRWKPILFVEVDHHLTDRPHLIASIEALGYVCTQRTGNVLGMPI